MATTTPGELLDQIDAYLSDDTPPLEERRALWDILVGLRGPDKKSERKELKQVVTGVIRAHAFPRLALRIGNGSGDKKPGFQPTFRLNTSLRQAAGMIPDKGTGHYHTHAWRALLALAAVRQHSSGATVPSGGVRRGKKSSS